MDDITEYGPRADESAAPLLPTIDIEFCVNAGLTLLEREDGPYCNSLFGGWAMHCDCAGNVLGFRTRYKIALA